MPQVAAACLVAYFGFHAILGDRGLFAYLRLQESLAQATALHAELQAQHAALAHRVKLLRPDSLDPDLLSERARAVLNFVRADDVVVLREPREHLESARDEAQRAR